MPGLRNKNNANSHAIATHSLERDECFVAKITTTFGFVRRTLAFSGGATIALPKTAA
jgi:hypothetical protein